MRYLEERPFLDWKGKQVSVKLDGAKPEQLLTTGQLVNELASTWSPNVREAALQIGDIRKLQSCLTVLAGEPANGYWVFETGDFDVLGRVVKIMILNSTLAIHAPQLEDMLANAPQKLVEKVSP